MAKKEDYQAEDKKLDAEERFPFDGVDKNQVLQESRLFGERRPNPRQCVHLITKILHVIGQGSVLRADEATDVFMKCTMLFSQRDKKLRRMLYIILKLLADRAEQTFIACSSLTTDMNRAGSEMPFKANVLRTLRAISDLPTFVSLERHFAESLVDQEPSVSSAAVITGIFFSSQNMDLVRRWTPQVVSAMKSRFHMVQYHALALMYLLQSHDPLSVSKLVLSGTSNFRSPLAHLLLIRYCVKVLQRPHQTSTREDLLKYLDSCLRYKNEMIVLAGAKALATLPMKMIGLERLESMITAVRAHLLTVSYDCKFKSIAKFAGLRLLAKIAEANPTLVSRLCRTSLDELSIHTNRSIGTLAICTILNCSTEDVNTVALTRQITAFFADVSVAQKIQVVHALKNLVLRISKKRLTLLNFMSRIFMKMHGGRQVKCAVAKAIIEIMRAVPDVESHGVGILCELIEDCEYDLLLQEIISAIADMGPGTLKASMCIRYIYNRLFLDVPSVRTAAVNALMRFGEARPELRQSVLTILKRTSTDPNDDVRDRGVYACFVLEGLGEEDIVQPQPDPPEVESIMSEIDRFERGLFEYIQDESRHEQAIDLGEIVRAAEEAQEERVVEEKKAAVEAGLSSEQDVGLDSSNYARMVAKIRPLRKLGKPFKTCEGEILTEAEGDYVVYCIKHIYPTAVVLQFNCRNNVRTQSLHKVMLEVDASRCAGVSVGFGLKLNTLKYGESKTILVSTELDDPSTLPMGAMTPTLTFLSLDLEEVEEEGEFDSDDLEENEYDLEDVQLRVSDFMVNVDEPNFKDSWESFEKEQETEKKAELPRRMGLNAAVDRVLKVIGLKPLNQVLHSETKTSHSLYFAAGLPTGETVLIASKVLKRRERCGVVVYARSGSPRAREFVTSNISF